MEVYIMKIFSNTQRSMADSEFKRTISPQLKEKDGLVHVIMINSFSKWINQMFCCEDKYTNQIDEVLTNMQLLGYEIVDVKFTVIQNQGIFKNMEGFNTLIMYK